MTALNALSGIVWPLHFTAPGSGLLGPFRALAVYWAAMFAAGAFVFGSVLTVQGLAAQLPRRWFLRLSGLLQMVTFCLFLSVFLFEPPFSSPAAFASARNQHPLACLPTYWFLALFQSGNGSARRRMLKRRSPPWRGRPSSGLRSPSWEPARLSGCRTAVRCA